MASHYVRQLSKTYPGIFLISFVGGAALEYAKIKWWIFGVNFYDVYERKHVPEMLASKEEELKKKNELALHNLEQRLRNQIN
jgi:hypothetical protein